MVSRTPGVIDTESRKGRDPMGRNSWMSEYRANMAILAEDYFNKKATVYPCPYSYNNIVSAMRESYMLHKLNKPKKLNQTGCSAEIG